MTPRSMPSVRCSASAVWIVALGISYAAPARTGYRSRGPNTWNWLSQDNGGDSGCGARGFGSNGRYCAESATINRSIEYRDEVALDQLAHVERQGDRVPGRA